MKNKGKFDKRRIWLRRGASLAIAIGCPAIGAHAQTAPSIQPDTSQTDDIVVTAQKRTESLQNVPISISVVGGRELDKSAVGGVAETLTRVPGVTFSPSANAGGGTVTVRGVSAPESIFGGSSPVAYYLDSVPFGLIQSALVPDASPYDLDRVEVLRGPQGTLYGASALAGVVRVLTKDPDLAKFDLKFRGSGSYTESGGNNYRGDLAVNVPIIDDKLAIRAVVGYQDQSGWINTPIQKNANDDKVQNYRFKIGANPVDGLSIVASAWISRDKSGGISAGSTYNQRNVLIAEPNSNDFDAYGLKATYDFHAFSVTSNTSYLKYRSTGQPDGAFPLGGSQLPIIYGFDSKIFTEELLFASQGSSPWRWTGGLFYRDAKDNDLVTVEPFGIHFDWTNKSQSYAIFGELTRLFADDKFEITLGGRYFHDKVTALEGRDIAPINPPNYYRDQANFSAATPRVVLTWHPEVNWSAYASYSQGFRSGSPQAYYSVNGVLGFPHVKPDRLSNYEVGLKGGGRTISFDASVYYMHWAKIQQEVIVLVGTPPVGVDAIINGKSANGIGVDFSATLHPALGLDLGGSVSWNNLRSNSDILSNGAVLFAKDDRLNFSPETTASLFGNYSFPVASDYTGKLSVAGNYIQKICSSTVNGSVAVIACGKDVLTTRASFSIESTKGWSLTLFGENLNNFRAPVVGSSYFGPEFQTRLRPRTIGLQFEYHL